MDEHDDDLDRLLAEHARRWRAGLAEVTPGIGPRRDRSRAAVRWLGAAAAVLLLALGLAAGIGRGGQGNGDQPLAAGQGPDGTTSPAGPSSPSRRPSPPIGGDVPTPGPQASVPKPPVTAAPRRPTDPPRRPPSPGPETPPLRPPTTQAPPAVPAPSGPAGQPTLVAPRDKLPDLAQQRQQALLLVAARGGTADIVVGFDALGQLQAIKAHDAAAAGAAGQRVFFFVEGQLVSTDSPPGTPAVRSTLAAVDAATVAVTYDLFHDGDPTCCPTAGSATVRYQLSGGTVSPLDPVPPLSGPVHR